MKVKKYDKKYCDMLIKHMKEGESFSSFAGTILVSRQTINDWVHKHKEFAEAYDIGKEACRHFWEKLGIGIATGATKGNALVWITNMNNRFKDEWSNENSNKETVKLEVSYKEPEKIIKQDPNEDET